MILSPFCIPWLEHFEKTACMGVGNCNIQSGMNYLVYFELNQYK
jgi:hypothetical protein